MSMGVTPLYTYACIDASLRHVQYNYGEILNLTDMQKVNVI